MPQKEHAEDQSLKGQLRRPCVCVTLLVEALVEKCCRTMHQVKRLAQKVNISVYALVA
jgi:hypothetical protein